MRRSVLYHMRLKPECVEIYREMHDHMWPDLIRLYRDSGITELRSYLLDNELMVILDVETERYDKVREALDNHPLELRWQAAMAELADPTWKRRTFREVFFMDDQTPSL